MSLHELSGCAVELSGTGLTPSQLDASGAAPGSASGQGKPASAVDAGQDEIESGAAPEQDAGPAGAGAPGIDGSTPDPGCVVDGRFALRIHFDVSWIGTEFASIVPVIREGSGELTILALMELASSPSGLGARFRECAARVPEFVATISREHYQTQFKPATWDAPSMPVFESSAETDCRDPGCALRLKPIQALVGAALPPSSPWPTDTSGAEWPDHDGDGERGIAALMLGPSDGDYAYPPLNLLSTRRVHDLMLGLRMALGLDGALESCDAFSGKTRDSSIQTRAVGCHAFSQPLACSASELRFLNDNLPVWTVKAGAFQAKRVAPSADCGEVRALFAQP